MKKLVTLAAIAGMVLLSMPSEAAVRDRIDMPQGNNVSVGLFGLSYDYSISNFSIGTFISGMDNKFQGNVNLGLRTHYKFFEANNLCAGVIAGVVFDPGTAYQYERGNFTPDIGVGVAYHFEDIGINLRLNLTFASSRNNYYPVASNSDEQISPNFLQTITIGPNTSFELGYKLNEQSELTIGGGSYVGIRMNF